MFACACGSLHALRNRRNYAGDWWEWEALTYVAPDHAVPLLSGPEAQA